MYCWKCGAQRPETFSFCPECGAPKEAPSSGGRHRSSVPVVVGVAIGSAVLVVAGAVGYQFLDERRAGDSGPSVDVVVSPEDLAVPESGVPSASPPPPPSVAPSPTSPPPPPSSPPAVASGDFSALFDQVRSGVLMVRATTCDGSGGGSGFLVGDVVVTAAHVVDGAVSVVVATDQGAVHEVSVVGIDENEDIAVLAPDSPIAGHTFGFAGDVPAPGSPVAVIGHPYGDPLTITVGTSSRNDAALWPTFQIDVEVNPGNSGGPVIGADGSVVGLLTARDAYAPGLGYAVRADVVGERIASGDLPAPAAPACAQPYGPSEAEVPEVAATDDITEAASTTLADYFFGINSGDYALAFDQLSPRLQGNRSYEDFAAGLLSSYDFGFLVHSVVETADGAEVWLEFISVQDPQYGPDGEGCTMWSLDYRLVWNDAGRLVIDGALGHGDASGHTPCT